MKEKFDAVQLPTNSVFLGCSSHEDRCLAVAQRWGGWHPLRSAIFHYDDPNPRREQNHERLRAALSADATYEIRFTAKDTVTSFHAQRAELKDIVADANHGSVVVDISVFTKRHLLMLLRWLDDQGLWDRLWLIYTEPAEYQIQNHMPLSFGISSIEPVPGFTASADPSRPLHLAMFLGYEGDRALATYETVQAQKTTLIIPDPPFRESWLGRTESLNSDLITVVGAANLRAADALDPASSVEVLSEIFKAQGRSDFSCAIAPLGTKPQVCGAYMYIRHANESPAMIYTESLRHNHGYYSRGAGPTWLIHRPS